MLIVEHFIIYTVFILLSTLKTLKKLRGGGVIYYFVLKYFGEILTLRGVSINIKFQTNYSYNILSYI